MRSMLTAIAKSAVGQLGALVCGVVCVKILAVISGPVGVGLYSLLRQVQVTLSAVASLGGQNAIVQGVASRRGESRHAYIAWVLIVVSAASLLVGLGLFGLAERLAEALLPGLPDGPSLFRWTALATVIGAFWVTIRSVLNGCMLIGGVAWTNVAAAAASMALAYPAATAQVSGHLAAPAWLLISSLTVGLLVAIRSAYTWQCLRFPSRAALRASAGLTWDFLRLALPSLLTLLSGLGAVLVVRAFITRSQGLAAAGHFDAAWSINVTMVVAFLTSVQTYLLPALSEPQSERDVHDVLFRAIRLSALIALPFIVVLIVLKPWLIRLLYSADFVPALTLLRWTLLGDFLRVVGWVFATSLLARADMRFYVIAELSWNACFLGVAWGQFFPGIEGIGPAYVAAYGVYFVLLLWRVTRVHAFKLPRAAAKQWLGAAVIVGVVSAITWRDTALDVFHIGLLLAPALAVAIGMTSDERRALASRLTLVARWFVRH